MPIINEEVTIGDDLTNLGPVELIGAIQGLLLSNASDVVRSRLQQQQLDIGCDAPVPRNDDSFTAEDLLESPFFIAKNLRTILEVRPNSRDRNLTGHVSTTARAVLKDFYGYNVTFDEWDDFQTVIGDQGISGLGTLPKGTRNWGRMVQKLLSRS